MILRAGDFYCLLQGYFSANSINHINLIKKTPPFSASSNFVTLENLVIWSCL